MPVHTYTNWNQRPSDQEEQIEPFRKYFFICEGANTETFYFKHLIDLRKELGIHPLIDIRLWEKTEEDKNISFAPFTAFALNATIVKRFLPCSYIRIFFVVSIPSIPGIW